MCGVFGMLFLKIIENRRKRKDALSRFLSSFDALVHDHLSNIGDSYADMQDQSMAFLKDELPKQSKYFFMLLNKQIRERYKSLWPNIRGNRVLKEGGPVSPFLKDIAKHREEVGRGRIDDGVVE